MGIETDGTSTTAMSGPATTEIEREVLSWTDFAEASRELATTVLASGFRPDVVIAIARGGLLLAGAISYSLGTKNCGSINVEFYTGIDSRLPEPVLSGPMLDAPALAGKKVLLVDDVSDSGHTLTLVVKILSDTGADVRTATLYTKPRTVMVPDFTWRETDRWIVFPWSALPPVDAGVMDAGSLGAGSLSAGSLSAGSLDDAQAHA